MPLSPPPLLIAIDLDGTLVEPRKPVRARVIEAVRAAIAAGVRATIVTGRMYVGTKPFVELLDLDGPIVLYQGAVIADARTGRFERELAMPHDVAIEIYTVAKKNGYHVQFYRNDEYFVEENNRYAQLYGRTSGTAAVVVPSLPEAFAGQDSTKVNIVTDIDRTQAAFELMQATLNGKAYVTRSNPEFVEMMNPKVDKGNALRLVAERLGVPMERVLAIGDSYNDLPLLRAAGFAVAMGSSPDELKAEADAVVADVEHDGVAEAIERFVL
jgi:Cof subfamily protein (haloacid dehalogenase superfamily)